MNRLKSIRRLLNLRCREVSLLASQSLDRDLGGMERFALRSHLLYCTACRRFLQHIKRIRQALGNFELDADSPRGPGMPAEVRKRIQQAMKDN